MNDSLKISRAFLFVCSSLLIANFALNSKELMSQERDIEKVEVSEGTVYSQIEVLEGIEKQIIELLNVLQADIDDALEEEGFGESQLLSESLIERRAELRRQLEWVQKEIDKYTEKNG